MNTSKGVIMKPVNSSFFPVFAALLSASPLAQAVEPGAVKDPASSTAPQHVPSVVYQNFATQNLSHGTSTADQAPDLPEGTLASSRLKFFRTDDLRMTNSRSNVLLKNDRISFTMKAPNSTVNGALSFVGTVYQTRLDGEVTRWVQVLSLVATRKINAEISYSAKIDKYSSIDSVLSYGLHPATDSGRNSEAAASIRYRVKF